MTDIKVEVDPSEVGFDAARLQRLDDHFRRYVDDDRLPGWLIAVARGGRIAHLSTYGSRDKEADLPVETDTLFRMYSMTKPITSVAAMMLFEQGAFELKDPVADFIPAFGDVRVYRSGSPMNVQTEGLTEPMRVWHLLTHMAGLTYGFHRVHPVDAMYRRAGFEWSAPDGLDLEAVCNAWAQLPLLFQPGSSWNYSVATDVLGRVVEVASGLSLDEMFRTRIFEPLGMDETTFAVDPGDEERLAALYVPFPPKRSTRIDSIDPSLIKPSPYLSGGGGLVSTAGDYLRFCEMLRRGGELEGARLLSPRTVRYMTANHLPDNRDLGSFDPVGFAETSFDGVGFGLGFSMTLDPVANKTLASIGDYQWGGAASTAFWVDPAEDIVALFLTQLLPSSTYSIRPQMKQLVHQALIE